MPGRGAGPGGGSLRDRLAARGPYAWPQAAAAALALCILLTPLRERVADPATWVLADGAAGLVVALLLLAREGLPGVLYAGTVLGGMAFLALWIALDEGLLLVPALLGLFTLRAWAMVRWGGGGATEEMVRVTAAALVAGIPAAVAFVWVPDHPLPGGLLSVLFFLASGWFILYPPMEWILAYRPPAGRDR